MALVNKAVNEITLKLVYYGPGLCGKTTNLEKIHSDGRLQNKGKLISMATETDRTLFFDFMPMELGSVRGQKIRVQLYTVPGQVFYNATRKLVLRGADGVVFVADSQPNMRESNIESLVNLHENLRINRIDPSRIPIVYQANKRDIPGVDSVQTIAEYLSVGQGPVVEAAAIEGKGVRETLQKAISLILINIRDNVDISLRDDAPAVAEPGVAAEPAAPFLSEEPVAPPPLPSSPQENAGRILESARNLVVSLEAALEAARDQERILIETLGRR